MSSKQNKVPDFVTEHSGTVQAAYATGPEVLRRDDSSRRGVPFLFIGGHHAYDTLLDLKNRGIYFAPISQLSDFMSKTNWSTAGPIPKSVKVGNEGIPIEELLIFEPERRTQLITGRDIALDGRIVHVPYSFGRFHEQDIRQGTKVRTKEEYQRMLREIIPSVFAERQAPQEKGGLEGKLQGISFGDVLFLHSEGLSVVGYVTGSKYGQVTLSRYDPNSSVNLHDIVVRDRIIHTSSGFRTTRKRVVPSDFDLYKFSSYGTIAARDIPADKKGTPSDVNVGDILFLHTDGLSVIGYVSDIKPNQIALSPYDPHSRMTVGEIVGRDGFVSAPHIINNITDARFIASKRRIKPNEYNLSEFTSYGVVKAKDIPKNVQPQLKVA